MGISLKLITSATVALIVILVAGACLGVTLATIISTINTVGEKWATGLSHSLIENCKLYFNHWNDQLTSATILVQSQNLTLPGKDPHGRNWTDTFIPYLTKLGSMHEFSYASITAAFTNKFWMYLSPASRQEQGVQKLEWMENLKQLMNPVQSDISVGGFRINETTLNKVPYSETTNYTYAILSTNQSLVLNDNSGVLYYLNSIIGPNDITGSIFSPIRFTYLVTANRYFEAYFISLIRDREGNGIGTITAGLDVESELKRLLERSRKSPNGESFVVQNDGTLLSTTRPESFWTSEISSVTATVPKYCYSTYDVLPLYRPVRIGCLKTTNTYPYPPLNAIGISFATTPGFRFGFFDSGGGYGTIAAASQRLRTQTVGMSFNVVIVIPDEDLYFGTVNSSIGLSVGLTVLVAAVAIGLALLLLHFLIKRLELVQSKMIAIAKLHNLDEDKNFEDADAVVGQNGAVNLEDSDEAVDVFFGRKARPNATATNNEIVVEKLSKNNESGNGGGDQDENNTSRSWIAEIAHLEDAYQETARSMTNFTRYVSRAVVSELIMQRKMAVEKNISSSTSKIEPTGAVASSTAALPHQATTTTAASSGSIIMNNPNIFDDADITQNMAAEYDVTVLIAEIEGFSSQIWKTHPDNHDGVLYILHIYFKRMCRLIMGHGGVVDKFLGDSIMSYWGAPVRTDNHALLATLAALSLLRESRRDPLKKIFETTVKREVELRCGLSSGNAIVGTFGNAETVNYSIVGAPVTQARHLQEFNKYWGSSILMDGNCMRKVDETIISRLLCQARFDPAAGRPEHVYEVMGLNLESKLAREKIHSDTRTFAFTDVLSLPTLHSNNQGVEEILNATSPEHESTIDGLLNWHAKGRTCLPQTYVVFAEQFSDAARDLIDCRFVEAGKKLRALDFSSFITSSFNTTSSGSKNILQSAASLVRSKHSDSNSSSGGGGDLASSKNNNSNHNSSTNSSLPPEYLIFVLTPKDETTSCLLSIADIYSKNKLPAHSLHDDTKTFFIRAHKLDGIVDANVKKSRQAAKLNQSISRRQQKGVIGSVPSARKANRSSSVSSKSNTSSRASSAASSSSKPKTKRVSKRRSGSGSGGGANKSNNTTTTNNNNNSKDLIVGGENNNNNGRQKSASSTTSSRSASSSNSSSRKRKSPTSRKKKQQQEASDNEDIHSARSAGGSSTSSSRKASKEAKKK